MLNSLQALIALFQTNFAQYKSPNYDEANTRTDFIDKFFELLGWDVRNTAGYSEQYRDVVREDHLEMDNRPKAPDYSFRIGGYRKFFVEAKKPSINIKDDISPAFQIRRYGYTAKLPLSILTDFEEFAVYDTRIKPHKNDKASVARIFYCRFDEYLTKSSFEGYETNFDYIVGTFSKENILKGSFDRYTQATKNKRGTSEVDQELLALVEEWRLILARSIAKMNPALDDFSLNVAVQRIVDRILFLRIAEDRRIERYDNLLNTTKGTGVYARLQTLFAAADTKYNAGLFKQERWLDEIAVDDKILASMITGLYYPESPYAFSVLPIEILGSIYERFLGKTIKLSANHHATVEEKPEVRKSGGVYYTPQHIVDYIIRETIGSKLNVDAAQLPTVTTLDPACGSGSFLVGAYTFFLDTHLSFYTQEQNLKRSLKSGVIYESSFQTSRLSIEEKQRILLANIFGVDIDPIAVEVTKLSLYLKLLENETEESREMLFRHSDLKMLPNLDANIRCGNSLIESDFYGNKNLSLFDDRSLRKVNAFDWHKAFPKIFASNLQSRNRKIANSQERYGASLPVIGFDCIIGNPPWGQKAAKFNDDQKEYFTTKFPASSVGILDLFRFFIEQSINLLKPDGVWGQVLPDVVLLKDYESTRDFLLQNVSLSNIDHWGKAFSQVNIEACTMIGVKRRFHGNHSVKIGIHHKDDEVIQRKIRQKVFTELPGKKFNLHLTDTSWNLLKKLSTYSTFGEFFEVHEGIHSGNVREKLFVDKKLNAKCKKLIFGRDEVQRYHLHWAGKWVHYTKDYFRKNEYAGLGKPEYFECSKLVIRRTGDYVLACLDEKGYYFSNNVFVCVPRADSVDLKVFLVILNSRLLTWYYRTVQPRVGKMFAEIKINLINGFPIPFGETLSALQKKAIQRLSSLADQMLLAQNRYRESSSLDHSLLEQRLSILDKQIDALVYELYGLNDEEVRIMEGGI